MHDFRKCEVEKKALALLGILQAMYEERKAHKENSLQTNQTDFRER